MIMNEYDVNNTTLILGFFDGIHLGHRKVLESAVEYAKSNNSQAILITFSKSPSEYFNNSTEYIFDRKYNYNLIKSIGIDRIVELDFDKIVNISAEEFLSDMTKKYAPLSIFTGFNYTFGYQRIGTPDFLSNNQNKYGYKYYCVPDYQYENETVSSTNIKMLLRKGQIESANKLLSNKFRIASKVVEGAKLGRELGFPTANLVYPENIIKIPYGVYKAEALNKPAILNWGIKPTVGENHPILEVHIPGFDEDLYNQEIEVKFIKRIRDERKFDSLEELKSQIEKDLKICLE